MLRIEIAMGQAVQTASAVILDSQEAALPEWSLLKRIVFRFVCSYLMLYNLPMVGHVNLLEVIPGVPWLSERYNRAWHAIVPCVAIHVFNLSGPVTVYPAVNGSGDTTLDYVEDLCLVAAALLATVVWSLIDFKRRDYRRIHFYLRVYVRYALSFTLFGYGFAKVFPTQFIFPTLGRLVEPLGEFSPRSEFISICACMYGTRSPLHCSAMVSRKCFPRSSFSRRLAGWWNRWANSHPWDCCGTSW